MQTVYLFTLFSSTDTNIIRHQSLQSLSSPVFVNNDHDDIQCLLDQLQDMEDVIETLV